MRWAGGVVAGIGQAGDCVHGHLHSSVVKHLSRISVRCFQQTADGLTRMRPSEAAAAGTGHGRRRRAVGAGGLGARLAVVGQRSPRRASSSTCSSSGARHGVEAPVDRLQERLADAGKLAVPLDGALLLAGARGLQREQLIQLRARRWRAVGGWWGQRQGQPEQLGALEVMGRRVEERERHAAPGLEADVVERPRARRPRGRQQQRQRSGAEEREPPAASRRHRARVRSATSTDSRGRSRQLCSPQLMQVRPSSSAARMRRSLRAISSTAISAPPVSRRRRSTRLRRTSESPRRSTCSSPDSSTRSRGGSAASATIPSASVPTRVISLTGPGRGATTRSTSGQATVARAATRPARGELPRASARDARGFAIRRAPPARRARWTGGTAPRRLRGPRSRRAARRPRCIPRPRRTTERAPERERPLGSDAPAVERGHGEREVPPLAGSSAASASASPRASGTRDCEHFTSSARDARGVALAERPAVGREPPAGEARRLEPARRALMIGHCPCAFGSHPAMIRTPPCLSPLQQAPGRQALHGAVHPAQ